MVVTPLGRKLARDLWRLKGQVITIALVVASGMAAFIGLRSTWASLAVSRDGYYSELRMGDVFVHLERAPEAVRAELEAIPGVALAYTRVVETVRLPLPELATPALGQVVSIPDDGTPPLNGLYLRAGRLPAPDVPDEVVVNEAFATAHDLRPGSRLPAVLGGKRRELRVVGVALSPEYVFAVRPGSFSADDRGFAILWMARSFVAPVFDLEEAFNDVSLRLQPGASQAAALASVDRLLEPHGGLGAVGRDRQLSNHILEGELGQLQQLATVVPTIFLAVAAFLLNVVLARLVNVQRQEIAALKALGYADREVGKHYLGLVGVVVALGALVGVGFGVWIGRGMLGIYARYFRFPVLGYELSAPMLALGLLVTAAAGVLGALLTVRAVVRLPPAEAMRPPAPTRYRRRWWDRSTLVGALGVSFLMVLREVLRRPLRTAFSALGIAAAAAILVLGRFTTDSFEGLIDLMLYQARREDVTVTFIRPVEARVADEVRTLPGVREAEGLRAVPVRIRAGHRSRDTALLGLPADVQLRRVVDRSGRAVPLPPSGALLSRKLAEILAVHPGDRITVEVREGQRERLTIAVAGLVDDSFGLQVYMTMAALHAELGEEPAISSVALTHTPDSGEALRARFEASPLVSTLDRTQDEVDRLRAQTGETTGFMTLVVTLLAVFISVGVVYNNARIALSLRGRDLASLRVIGFSRREISSVLLGEIAVQVVLGVPVGLWLGTVWARLVAAGADPETFRLPVVVSTRTYVFAALIALGSAAASALWVRRQLDRLDLVAVLKSKE